MEKQLDNLGEKVRKWTRETASKYCKDCKDNCCNGYKHRIDITESELKPFLERGIPIARLDDLNQERAFEKGHLKIRAILYTKNGQKIPRPSLIQTRKAHSANIDGENVDFETTYALYVDKYCPFYDKKSGCEIHEDPKRSEVCKTYPVFRLTPTSRCFSFNSSCKLFNQKEVREAFKMNFPEPIVLGVNTEKGVRY